MKPIGAEKLRQSKGKKRKGNKNQTEKGEKAIKLKKDK
jgi:hypothetical protein